MATYLDRRSVTSALLGELQAIDDLVSRFEPDQWRLPTDCPGWDVQAVVVHVLAIEASLQGHRPPAGGVRGGRAHVRNDLGHSNEDWIEALASWAPDQVLTRYREVAAGTAARLDALTDEQWAEVGATPAGDDTHGRFMRIRVLDCWIHEQDLRAAVAWPGHESGPIVDLVLDELSSSLGFVVGKRAGAPSGSSVTFRLQGPAAREVHVAMGDRAAVVEGLPGPATTTLTMPAMVFVRGCAGRRSATEIAAHTTIDGDGELGERVLAGLGFMI